MKLTVLGSGYFIPTKDRNNSGYLLEIGGELLLLDTGSGILRQLIKTGHSVWDIDRIFYSHMHLDHISDLLPILFTRKYSQPEQLGDFNLNIYGHSDIRKVIDIYESLFGKWIINENYPYKFQAIDVGEYEFGSYSLNVFQGNHADQSLMYRFKDSSEKTLLYTSDTDFSEELITAAIGINALLIECSSSNENPVAGHMTPNKISELLDLCRPEMTILTHLSPETDRGSLIHDISVPPQCKIFMAEDFSVYTI